MRAYDPSPTLGVHRGNGFDARFRSSFKVPVWSDTMVPPEVRRDMRRRGFRGGLGGAAAAWPMAARGQIAIRRIGVLSAFAEDDPEARGNIAVFGQALEKLGWTDGGNARIDYRWGDADTSRIRAYAPELLGLKPDVFLVSTALVLQPLRQLTRDIPIVFTRIIDPVGSGFVASLAHPGGNITGFTPAEFSIYGKSLEVLKEVGHR